MRLEAHAVTAGYQPRHPVLQQVSVALATGAFVGLLGPNGCGKSTLLRILSGAMRPMQGRVTLDGRALLEMSAPEIARNLAFVPQTETAAFEFTVRDITLMGRYAHRAPFQPPSLADYAAVEQALADMDILALADRSVTRLSGGEHRRVLLARALAQAAPLLLLDEPTSHLDVTHQFELMARLQTLTRERQAGALAALHDLNQAAEFCDALILMHAGRIIATGTPSSVLTPDNLRAAYQAEAHIGLNPLTGKPMILTLRPLRSEPLRAAE